MMVHKKSRRDPDDSLLDDPRLTAAVDLIGHTGALSFQIRYDDEKLPIIWNAVALYDVSTRGGYAHFFDTEHGKHVHAKVAAGLSPTAAVFRLCDEVVDGGRCGHCNRPTGFSEDQLIMPLDDVVCWYVWDPELKIFRRGCAGDIERQVAPEQASA
jgi:hypothetical protein